MTLRDCCTTASHNLHFLHQICVGVFDFVKSFSKRLAFDGALMPFFARDIVRIPILAYA